MAAACMVLEFLGQAVSEADLAHLLGTQAFGTPASNLRRLDQMGLSVIYESATLATLRSYVQSGIPCLVFVRTGDLPYWEEDTAHVLVAVGVDDEFTYVNDPAFDEAPQTIPLDYFLLAWSEFDHRFGVIRRRQ